MAEEPAWRTQGIRLRRFPEETGLGEARSKTPTTLERSQNTFKQSLIGEISRKPVRPSARPPARPPVRPPAGPPVRPPARKNQGYFLSRTLKNELACVFGWKKQYSPVKNKFKSFNTDNKSKKEIQLLYFLLKNQFQLRISSVLLGAP